MAIIALPDGPEDRWEKWTSRGIAAAAAVVFALFLYSLLDAYLF